LKQEGDKKKLKSKEEPKSNKLKSNVSPEEPVKKISKEVRSFMKP
jgi:hypothetical protein